jgi:UDP-N-acetylglucosamine 2-epimerase (non-hydrolysing)
MRVMSIFGTRPEAIKMAPVVHALSASPDIESIVCVTGQHRDMLDQVLDLFEIVPDEDLNLMRPNQSLHTLTARMIDGLHPLFTKHEPDAVLVHGDTTSCLAGALAAFYARIPVGHVEAGLRTHDLTAPFPEEGNRQLTDRISTWCFAPTERSANTLRLENLSDTQIHITGNTVIDALLWMRHRLPTLPTGHSVYGTASRIVDGDQSKILLVTGHRRESFGDGFERICQALKEIAHAHPALTIIYPVHLNPNVQKPVYELLSNTPNIHLIPPLGYQDFIRLMDRSHLILTDSGGIQEEAPSLNKPTLVMRDCTERPEGIDAGVVKLVGTDPTRIISEVSSLFSDETAYAKMSLANNPYGDGHAAERITQILSGKISSGH